MLDDGDVHQQVMAHILATGRAPAISELAMSLTADENDVAAALRRLQDGHGLVLHAGGDSIWIAHPFALWPTPFLVRRGAVTWWGNCAWCSFGIAALAGDVNIVTRLGAEDERVELRVTNGRLNNEGYVVHFPTPPARAWENVVYFCGTTLLFRNGAEVEAWCARHGIARGAVVPAAQVLLMARAWYGNHLAPRWRKWTVAEAQAIFENAGLTGSFWELPKSTGRF
jgi:hypothetical protein